MPHDPREGLPGCRGAGMEASVGDGLRVLVCGGRDFTDAEAFDAAMERFTGKFEIDDIIHGGARGADAQAERWAKERRIPTVIFAADWAEYGLSAGPRRNRQMLEEGRPTWVIAFPGGRGTADMVRRAEAAGLPVWRPYG